jgi:hypothetical protein
VAAGVAIAVAGRFATAAGAYEAGVRNADPPFILSRSDIIGLAAWGAALALLVFVAVRRRSSARHFARGALFACLAAVPLTCLRREFPSNAYTEGFCQWAATNVPADAVRKWAASRASVTKAATIASAQWPREIAGVSPDTVTELPDNRGLVLEWGRLSTWGTSRRVFVARDDTIPPPTTDEYWLFDWDMISPSVYAAFQHQD